jgi:hypothetical protein
MNGLEDKLLTDIVYIQIHLSRGLDMKIGRILIGIGVGVPLGTATAKPLLS